ncbi:MAG: uroporphyrinogen-III synthase [Saprospiraceae bacterium]
MADQNGTPADANRPVKTILISQPKPERSPYFDLETKWGIKIDWRPFIHVEGLSGKEFRKQRIYIEEYTAIIFTSRGAIDHFFRICEETRHTVSDDMRYFCISEAVSNYLQKFINYRKRKVFVGAKTVEDFKPVLLKAKAKDKFLLPCSNLGKKDLTAFLDEKEFNWTESMMYRTVASDLSDLTEVFYDVLVFFSPLGITSLYENFPTWEQKDTRLAIFGNSTKAAVDAKGCVVNIPAPSPDAPSMPMAIEKYLEKVNKRKRR